MIRWPHIGMNGAFEPCEEGLLAAINENFFLLDVLVQGSFIDYITGFPVDPLEGDTYIETSNNFIYTWDGDEWVGIEPQPGFWFWNQATLRFNYFDGTTWQTLPAAFGDVTGPGSSTDNAVVRFDGLTGKLIKNSIAILDDLGVLSGLTNILTDRLQVKWLDGFIESLATAGAAQNLTAPTGLITKLTGALTSVATIAAPSVSGYGRLQIYINNTGAQTTFTNGATLITGTGSDLNVKNGAAVWMVYDPIATAWIVIGGSGSGGGISGVRTISSSPVALTALDLNTYIRIDANGGHRTITLPAASTGGIGSVIEFKRIGSETYDVSIVPAGADTIDQVASQSIPFTNGTLRMIMATASAWELI